MREGYVNFAVADGDLFDEGFDDFPLIIGRQHRPFFVQRSGLAQHVIGGQLVDFQEINLGFKPGQFRLQRLHAFRGGGIEAAEAVPGNLLVQVQLMGLVHGFLDLLNFAVVGVEQGGFLG